MPAGAPSIDPDVVAARIGVLLREGRSGAVRPLLAALEKLAPEHGELALLQASYYCQMEDVPQALQTLADAIARRPDAALYLRRAEILIGQGDHAGAADNAAEAILLSPDLNRAKSTLGLALLGLQKFDMALPCLAESFEADPASVDVALAVAALQPEAAIETLTRAVTASPKVVVLRNALTRRHICAGNIEKALDHAGQSRADGVADAETYCLQAFAKIQQADWDEAEVAAAQAQSLDQGSRWAARLAAALRSRSSGELNPPPERDALAAEKSLFSGGTILPGSFRSLLQESKSTGPVLDLFCGTGLNAIAAQDVCPGPWTGIEPDAELLRLSAWRQIYAKLERADPLDFLGRCGQYPIILLNGALGLNDTLQLWFGMLRACLAPGGIALAAIPTGGSDLTGHGLFAHSMESVARHAQRVGLSVAISRGGILRHIEHIPLHGVIASFRRA